MSALAGQRREIPIQDEGAAGLVWTNVPWEVQSMSPPASTNGGIPRAVFKAFLQNMDFEGGQTRSSVIEQMCEQCAAYTIVGRNSLSCLQGGRM